MNFGFLAQAFSILLLLSSCEDVSLRKGGTLEFRHAQSKEFMLCLKEWDGEFAGNCRYTEGLLTESIGSRDGFEVTAIEQVWFEYVRNGRYSFETIEALVENGADIRKIARSIVDLGSLDDFKRLVRLAGGGNALAGTGLANGSIMHASIELWDSKKIDYLLGTNIDLEQTNDEGETALLVAALSPFEISRIEKMKILIERGANIGALDVRGRGVCEFLEKHSSMANEDGIEEVSKFRDYLRRRNFSC